MPNLFRPTSNTTSTNMTYYGTDIVNIYDMARPTPRPQSGRFTPIQEIGPQMWAVMDNRDGLVRTMSLQDMRALDIAMPTDTSESQVTANRKAEKDMVEQFIRTGVAPRGQVVVDDNSHIVTFFGRNMGDTNILFIISPDDSQILAKASRTKHLKKLLEGLAEREGWTLSLIDSSPPDGGGRELLYYAFENAEETDDSELIAQATFREPEFHDEDDMDCDCPECMEDMDDDDDDDEDW